MEPANARIATIFEDVACLLEAQHATEHRVRAWRRAAAVVAGHDVQLGEIYRGEGIAGLEAMPAIGYRLARVVVEILRTGTTEVLERLEGHHANEPVADAAPPKPEHHERGPSVAVLLELDRLYRARAAADTLPRVAPKRNNPERKPWLPILHVERDDWHFTALYSNTARAHELHKTHDWVVLYYDHDHTHGQATVVTEWKGKLSGRRVVRGHEAACAAYYAKQAGPEEDTETWGDAWES